MAITRHMADRARHRSSIGEMDPALVLKIVSETVVTAVKNTKEYGNVAESKKSSAIIANETHINVMVLFANDSKVVSLQYLAILEFKNAIKATAPHKEPYMWIYWGNLLLTLSVCLLIAAKILLYSIKAIKEPIIK